MRRIIATTELDQFTYGEYEDFCEGNGIEPGSDTSAEFYEWCADEASINWESDLDNIKDFKGYNVPVVITGHLGLWWGNPEIEPNYARSVYDAIMQCMNGADDVVVEYEDGTIFVHAMHHDGTNVFEINAIDGKLNYLYD